MTDAIQQPKNETSCLNREFKNKGILKVNAAVLICGGGGGVGGEVPRLETHF